MRYPSTIRTPDGITVNAVHEYLEGPIAVGEMIIGQSQCGVVATSVNQAPVANDDAYTTGLGQPLVVPAAGLLSNDTDPEAMPLTATKVLPTPPPTSGTSCAPFPARCAVWGSPSDPANGTLTLNADGSFTYVPTACFVGTDTFTYTASDERGRSDTATVSVTVSSTATRLSVDDVWVIEGNTGTTTAGFTINRCGNTTGTSTVKYKTTNGTATAGNDYTPLPLTSVTFGAGESAKAVVVTITGDSTGEPNETFNVVLSSPTGATISDTTGVGTIRNDDLRSYLSISDAVVTEGNAGTATATFKITRTGNTAGASTISYATADGTATAGSDYTTLPLTPVTFGAGQTTKTVSVAVTGDAVDEVNETFNLNLSVPGQAIIADGAGKGTIVDDDGAITPGPSTFLSVGDVAIAEGDGGAPAGIFTVTRTGNTSGASSVQYATADGTATAPGDYTATALTLLSFAAGETTKTVTVNGVGDTFTELDETFKLNLSAAVGGVISDTAGTATIVNDDFTSLSVNDVSIVEGSAGTTLATFTVSRSGNTTGGASVQYATVNGTATAGSDYSAIPLSTATFAAGETSKLVAVTITGDTTLESNEAFTVTLSAPVGGVISDLSGTGTIVNDD